MPKNLSLHSASIAAVSLAALGYFVDIYDLILFSIVRIPSLKDLGLAESTFLEKGVLLLNCQMTGMFVGGLVFGVLGDKKGRLSVLFGSIILYSMANILNSFVHTIEMYALLRFLAGVGLAGELGAGVTLVSEILPKEKRGYGTTIVASFGLCGAVGAWIIASHLNWRIAYLVGGVMGLALLALRMQVFESKMFEKMKTQAHIKKGDFLSLFRSRKKLFKFLACIFIGIPVWYGIGILITLCPEFAKVLNIEGGVDAGKAVMLCYVGAAMGDVVSGVLSQSLKSRKKAVLIFLVYCILNSVLFFSAKGISLNLFYWLCFSIGLSSGYWAMFVTISAEQFGTNLRATVTITTPNFVRGSLVLMTLLLTYLKLSLGIIYAAEIVGAITFTLALWGIYYLPESFSTDLDYHEN